MSERLRIALVEPYYGGSHRAWADGYAAHSDHDVETFSLPPVHWKWRMQGGHLTLAPQLAQAVAANGPFDVVLATSMTNVPALLATARRELRATPVALYMHENQLTFPPAPGEREDLTYAMTNWASMVAADLVVFNSEFHRDAWFDALPDLLVRMPDHRRLDLIDAVRRASVVLPVGVELTPLDGVPRTNGDPPLIVWNHRWHHDKTPGEFVDAVTRLAALGYRFGLALTGERTDPEPDELIDVRALLGDRIVHDGHADADTYRSILRRSDIVVSSAHQEFFGISLTEAVYAGAFPIVPNRVVYPERIPERHHRACLYETPDDLVDRLRWAIERADITRSIVDELRPVMAAFDWSTVAPRYDAALADLTR